MNHNQLVIKDMETECLELPQVECPVTHHFGPGVYIREVRIPKGTFSIGHYQNHEHLNQLLKGRVLMIFNSKAREISAPFMYVGKPGRKVGIILEDMVWQNIYSTNETNIEKLEEEFITKSDAWAKSKEAKDKLEYLSRHQDREDFVRMLRDVGVSKALVTQQSENTEDQTEMPNGSFNIQVSDSQIHGKGIFATSDFKQRDLIAPARIDGKRTPVGRYTNHSLNPNAEMVLFDSNISMVALKDISGAHGGELGEEITIDYRQAVYLQRMKLCQQ